MKTFTKHTYAWKDERMVSFSGHIKRATAIRRGFDHVALVVRDWSGKGRGDARHFYGREIWDMKP